MLIPRHVQCRIMASLLQGEVPPGFTLEQIERLFHAFDERWQPHLDTLLYAMEEPAGIKRASFIAGFVNLPSEESERISREAEREAHIPSLRELDLPEIEWVWEGWIPRDMLTVFGAMPSAGKSYVALDLAARTIAGTAFPDGKPVPEQGPVIYVDAENLPQIHSRRASAWGIDCSQLYVMQPTEDRLMIDLSDDYDRDRLVEWAWAKRPALIVVDSLSSVSSKGENSVEDVRGIFSFLGRVASDYHCGMLLIHHLRKPGAQLPPPRSLNFHDLRGSSHITAMSRSIIGLHWVQTGPERDLNDPRRMEVLKTNLCRYPEPIGVSFRSLENDQEVAEIVYGQVPQPYRAPTQRAECTQWLAALLEEHGALPPRQVVTMAAKAGYSRSTVYRARQTLGEQVVDTVQRGKPDNRWALADKA